MCRRFAAWLGASTLLGALLTASSVSQTVELGEPTSFLGRPRGSGWSEPIDTDRPTFTRSTKTVPRGAIQYEGGYVFEYFHQDGELLKTHVFPGSLASRAPPASDAVHRGFRANIFPGSLLRIGLTDNLELRLLWASSWFEAVQDGERIRRGGSADLGVALKLRLVEQSSWRPDSSVIIGLTAPTGAPAFTNGITTLHLNYLFRWALDNHWRVTGSTGFRTQADRGDQYLMAHQSVALENWFTESFQGFVEYFGLYFRGFVNDSPENYIQTGFRYRPTHNFQLDWHIGFGLHSTTLDFFTGPGLAVRF